MLQTPQVAVASTGRVASLRIAGLCLAGAGLAAIVPFVAFDQLVLYLVALTMAMAVFAPLWLTWSRGRLDWFEPVGVLGVLYFLYFGAGAVWAFQDPSLATYDIHLLPHIPRAALYCLFGWFAFLAGYYGPWHGKTPPLALDERPVGSLLLFGVGGIGLVGFLARAAMQHTFRLGGQFNVFLSSASQLWPLFVFAWALAWQLYFSGRIDRGQRRLLFGLFLPGALAVIYLTYGNKSLTMMLVGLPIVARWYVKRKIPWLLLGVLLLILVFVIFPLYNTYRWVDREAAHGERMAIAASKVANWDSQTYMRYTVGTFLGRMAMINSVAIVVRDVGRWEPFAKGETLFMPTLAFFVPRVLWRDKPTSAAGLEFGWKFRVTNFFTRETYIAPTWPGELYWNFGVPGMVLGLGLLGAGARWLYRRYAADGLGPVPRALWILFMVQLVFMLEGVIATGIAEIVRTVIMMEVIRRIALHYGLTTRRTV